MSTLHTPSILKINFPDKVKEFINYLINLEIEIYLIGGFVRDLILQNESFDLDFVLVDSNLTQFCKNLEEQFNGKSILLDNKTNTIRFVLRDDLSKKYTFDFTSVSKDDLEKDFLRRDFTFNALAINLKEPEKIIDKFNGIEDLKNKLVRAVDNKNFLDDPLRMLRAFRFQGLVKGEIEKNTFDFIKSNLNYFNENLAKERISHELWKTLDSEKSYQYIKQMSDVGILEKIFPELTPMRKVTPNDHHHLWLYDHSLHLVETLEENYHKIPSWAKEDLEKPIGEALSPIKKSVVKLGSIMHDIGKPSTWEIKNIDGKEKHTFYGHDKVGEEIVFDIGERMKFSTAITKTIGKLVRYHLRPFQLSQNNTPISSRALYRFFRDVDKETPLLLMLALSDHYATQGPKIKKEDLENGEKLILFLFDRYYEYLNDKEEKSKKPKLLSGNEIMELTGLSPSKKLGNLIKSLDEAIGIGEIKTKEEAINWIKSNG